MIQKLILLSISLFLLPSLSEAATKISVQSGDWLNPEIWYPQGIPNADDELVISHSIAAISIGSHEVYSLRLENNSLINASLRLSGNTTIVVKTDFTQNSANFDSTTELEIYGISSLMVQGNSFNIFDCGELHYDL